MPDCVHILMYHSISEGAGPTCIPPPIFNEQMRALEDCGYAVISVEKFLRWRRGELDVPSRSAVLTFDDGYLDFLTSAFPELERRGWTAGVFVPTGKLGGRDDWPGGAHRPLMDWRHVTDLAAAGIHFGAHTDNHVDLSVLPPAAALAEVDRSRQALEDRLGRPAIAFAPPYGRLGTHLRRELPGRFQLSVGTVLDRARRTCDLYDVPRIEMHYFRDPRHWQSFLHGRGRFRFAVRQALRSVRQGSRSRGFRL